MIVRIGTRGSALALWQTRHVAAQIALLVPKLRVEIVEIVSTGDRITDVPLTAVEGTGFFTATLERALIDERIDIAVHSYKDLPVETTPGLHVAAIPRRAPVEDVLCARDGLTTATLPRGSRVGTCSARRTAQLRAMRPDLDLRSLRGNVPTRVATIASGALDAVVLARAGLVRLGLDAHITEVFPLDQMLPAPAQGALAVQCRTGHDGLCRMLPALDDAPTRRAVTAERALLHALGGGCSVPVGAVAAVDEDGGGLRLAAGVFALDGRREVRAVECGRDPQALGEAAARALLVRGAGDILADFAREARLDMTTPEGLAP